MKVILIVIAIMASICIVLVSLLVFALIKCAKKKQPEQPIKKRLCDCLTENYEL